MLTFGAEIVFEKENDGMEYICELVNGGGGLCDTINLLLVQNEQYSNNK